MASTPTHLESMTVLVREALANGFGVAVQGMGTRRLLDHERTDRVPDVRVVAPSGVLDFQPDEMIVRCGAGTCLDDLRDTLARHGQSIDLPGEGTVGGALARGWSDVHRLGHGPIRDVVLETLFVGHRGQLVRTGGPTVKNVSGFDLTRVLVGSLGTLGLLGEVTLRTRPRPLDQRWVVVEGLDTERLRELRPMLYRPSSLLWNGSCLWVHLEGHPRDIDEVVERLDGRPGDPPARPPFRWSMSPAEALDLSLDEGDIVEIGVGIVHRHVPPPTRSLPAIDIHRRLDAEFNPNGLLNPHVRRFGDREAVTSPDRSVHGASADHSADTA